MDLEKLKRIKYLIIAKILFVFGWIYDLAMRILNAVNKTPIEKDKDRRNVRIKQFAIATSILYVIFNSIFIYIFKSMRRVSLNGRSGEYTSTHFMPWNIIVPSGFMMFIFEIILAMVVGLCITVKLHTLWRMKNDSKDIKGDNKFMEDNELLEHFQAVPMDNIKSAEQAGMLIGESNGMYYVETGTYNTMIVGAPRSGKGECYVLPSMRLMANSKNKPSLIINDMKGELLELTNKDFANNGYKIVTLNLIDILSIRTDLIVGILYNLSLTNISLQNGAEATIFHKPLSLSARLPTVLQTMYKVKQYGQTLQGHF